MRAAPSGASLPGAPRTPPEEGAGRRDRPRGRPVRPLGPGVPERGARLAASLGGLLLLLLGTALAPASALPPSPPGSDGPGHPTLACPSPPEAILRALEEAPGAPLPSDPGNPPGTSLPSAPAVGAAAGGILPHFDGAAPTILRLYRALEREAPPRRVILIAPDHFRAGRGPVSCCGADWETPWGLLRADADGAAPLLAAGLALRQDGMFPREHGITIHLPLIRRFFPGVPALLLTVRNNASDLQLLGLRAHLLPLLREGGILLLSMDLSHHRTPPEAAREDARTLAALLALRTRDLRNLDLDCPRGAALFLSLMRELGADAPVLLERSDSGSLSGGRAEPCTGFAAILYRRRTPRRGFVRRVPYAPTGPGPSSSPSGPR